MVAHDDRQTVLARAHLDLEHAAVRVVGVHDDVRARLGDRHLHVGQHGRLEVERIGHPRQRLPHHADALGPRGHGQQDLGAAGHSPAPFVLAAAMASSRRRSTGSTGTRPGDVEDPLHAGLDGLADADDEALVSLDRAAACVEQRAQHRGVDERRGREVDDDAAAAVERLVEALAQRRRGVDVVLAFDDDDHDIPGGVVEHDGIGFHTGMQDTRNPGRLTPTIGYPQNNGRRNLDSYRAKARLLGHT